MDKDELFELVELDDGTEVLFADCRVDRKDLPEGLYCYDLRGDDEDPGMPATIDLRKLSSVAVAVTDSTWIHSTSSMAAPIGIMASAVSAAVHAARFRAAISFSFMAFSSRFSLSMLMRW